MQRELSQNKAQQCLNKLFTGKAGSSGAALPYAEDLSYVSSASAEILQQSPRGGQQLLWSIASFFLLALIWSAWAEIDEFTRGSGKVIPSTHVQVIQNLEGGIVSDIYVKEGQIVSKKQTLVRIDDTRFSTSLEEVNVTLEQLNLKARRLQAESDGRPFYLNSEETTFKNTSLKRDSVKNELTLYDRRQKELMSNRQVLEEKLTQAVQELSELKARQSQLKRSYQLLEQELKITRPLVKSGAISQVELLRLERQLNDMAGEIQVTALSIPRVESSLQEARKKIEQVAIVFEREAQKEFNEVVSEISRLQEKKKGLEDRVKRTNVLSPVDGTVKQLLVKTIGGVIQPGMDIVEIVPSEDFLQIEAKIRPSDIAFLHPGQQAVIKLTAYDFSIHGGLEGNVSHISPDTITDENGESFYLVRIETEKSYLGTLEHPLPIIPGMVVDVDIITGKKTVLDYVLKPVLKTKQLALRER